MVNVISLLTPKAKTYCVRDSSTVRQVLEIFDAHKFTVLPLLDGEGRYISTVSEGDLLRFIKRSGKFQINDFDKTPITEINPYRPYKNLKIDSSIEEVIELSMEQNFIPITDDRGIFIGIIKRKEIIENLFKK